MVPVVADHYPQVALEIAGKGCIGISGVVLPADDACLDHDAELVGDAVEVVGLGVAAAPDAEHVEVGAAIFSDELKSYEGLESNYQHAVINHAIEYVNGNVHTNGLENFWSLLKRGIKGTYVSVEPFHLFRYLDEQSFRYNYREDLDDSGRFEVALSQVVGRRLTWKRLTGKTEDSETRPN